MDYSEIYENIKTALENAPRNSYVAEIHLQAIKYALELERVPGREFCEELGLRPAWGVEFTKMRKIASRLREAGLDPKKL